MPRLTGGQALVESLKREGVDTIFGLPGVQLDWAFDALYANSDTISVVHTRHEQATAYMADGYARTTGKVGTYIVVPGPGVLNTTAALSTAYSTSSPVLCITGQVQSDLIGVGRGALHEVEGQLEMLRYVTKWNARAMTPNEVPVVVHEAFRQLRSGRPAAGRDRDPAGRPPARGRRRAAPAAGTGQDGRRSGPAGAGRRSCSARRSRR